MVGGGTYSRDGVAVMIVGGVVYSGVAVIVAGVCSSCGVVIVVSGVCGRGGASCSNWCRLWSSGLLTCVRWFLWWRHATVNMKGTNI